MVSTTCHRISAFVMKPVSGKELAVTIRQVFEHAKEAPGAIILRAGICEVVVVDRDLCIGCGVCVVGCDTESMRLERRPEAE